MIFKNIVLILMLRIIFLVIIIHLNNRGLDWLYIIAILKKELLKVKYVKLNKKLKTILVIQLLDLMVFSIDQV